MTFFTTFFSFLQEWKTFMVVIDLLLEVEWKIAWWYNDVFLIPETVFWTLLYHHVFYCHFLKPIILLRNWLLHANFFCQTTYEAKKLDSFIHSFFLEFPKNALFWTRMYFAKKFCFTFSDYETMQAIQNFLRELQIDN